MLRVVEFKTEYRSAGKAPVEWVLVAPLGDGFEKTRTWHRVKDVMPREDADDKMQNSMTHIDMVAKWSVIEPAYNAWKSGQEIPVDGTPLAAWAGVTQEQAEFMKKLGIRTVEDVTIMGDSTISQLSFPNARELPKLAKKYLEGAELTAKDAELEAMRERVAAMEDLLNEKTEKRGPGRPRKQDSEAA